MTVQSTSSAFFVSTLGTSTPIGSEAFASAQHILRQDSALTIEQFEQLDELFRQMTEVQLRRLIDDPLHQRQLRSYEVLSWRRGMPLLLILIVIAILGLVASMSQPGGNLTGLTISSADAMSRRLSLLKEALPSLSKVRALWNPNNLAAAQRMKELQDAARMQRLEFSAVEARDAVGLPPAFHGAVAGGTEVLLVVDDPLFTTHRKQIVDLAAQHRLPAVYGFREFAEAGGLLAFGASLSDLYRRSAEFVAKILTGTRPGDLPVEEPIKFELIINLKTARVLGLTMPPTLLALADEVIQ